VSWQRGRSLKYWIDGVQQEQLTRLKLTIYDAVVLRYLRDLFANPEKLHKIRIQMKDGQYKTFYRIDRNKLLSEIPLLSWKDDTLKRRIQLYTKKNILTKKEIKEYLKVPTADHTYNRIFYHRFNKEAEQKLFHTPSTT
jgi:hypothetical protein